MNFRKRQIENAAVNKSLRRMRRASYSTGHSVRSTGEGLWNQRSQESGFHVRSAHLGTLTDGMRVLKEGREAGVLDGELGVPKSV